nr:zinc ribbon domain-containing protein [Thermaerobacter sp.]
LRAMIDAGIGEFLRMLAYKTTWHGSVLLAAPKGYKATRTCSECGWEGPDLPLSRRVFRCGACDLELDRDLNAARNLEKLAEEFLWNAAVA